MLVKTTLEYTYDPPKFFEEVTAVSGELGTVTFDAGLAILTLKIPTKPIPHDLISVATGFIRTALRSRQVLTRQVFTLEGPTGRQHHDDRGQDIVLFVGTGAAVATGFAPDLVMTGPNGEILRDTRQERLEYNARFLAALVAKSEVSALARRMIESFGRSIEDPSNELIHLYEIRDAVADHYGGDDAARGALRISKNDWSRLGRLANDEPLQQGRHRGRNVDAVRDATDEELREARHIARAILEAFAAAG